VSNISSEKKLSKCSCPYQRALLADARLEKCCKTGEQIGPECDWVINGPMYSTIGAKGTPSQDSPGIYLASVIDTSQSAVGCELETDGSYVVC